MPPRADFVPFPDVAAALRLGPKESPWYLSLNGPWKFHWSPRPADRPLDFWKPSVDVSGWKDMPVPSDWMFQGYDIPIYVNMSYEFAPNPKPPFVPHDHNPVGSYRRTFMVPTDWKGMDVSPPFRGRQVLLLRLGQRREDRLQQGLENAGRIEYHPVPQAGDNVLAVEVYRWSDGSYLECQDFWRLSRHRTRRLSYRGAQGPYRATSKSGPASTAPTGTAGWE